MPRHVYFVAPENAGPTGGINLMYWFAGILRENDYSASLHYRSSDYVYPYYQSDVPGTYSPQPEPLPRLHHLPFKMISAWRRSQQIVRRKGTNALSVPGADDLVVLPEVAAAKWLRHFPGVPVLVLAQDVHGAIRGSLVPLAGDVPGKSQVLGYLTTSEAVDAAVASFSSAPRRLVPQMFEPGAFGFAPKKKRQVAYMNRKRHEEVAILRTFLKPELERRGVDLVEIYKLTKRDALSILAESLVFVSLSHQEGFGMPPAEAMAMGCVTVGYTGVGGNEFFTTEVGFPIPDDDIVGLYRKVLEVVDLYDADPAPLDAMRRAASERVLATYRRENTSRALLKAIEELVI